MKKLSLLLVSLLVVILSFGVVGCSNTGYGALKTAFEKEKFKESKEVSSYFAQIEQEVGESSVKLHCFSKGVSYVLIIEFKATDDIVNFIKDTPEILDFIEDVKDNEDVKAYYNALQSAGYVKGSCLVIGYNVAEIFGGKPVQQIVREA